MLRKYVLFVVCMAGSLIKIGFLLILSTIVINIVQECLKMNFMLFVWQKCGILKTR